MRTAPLTPYWRCHLPDSVGQGCLLVMGTPIQPQFFPVESDSQTTPDGRNIAVKGPCLSRRPTTTVVRFRLIHVITARLTKADQVTNSKTKVASQVVLSCIPFHNQHWNVNRPKYGRGDTPEQLTAKIRPAMGSHNDKVDIIVLGVFTDAGSSPLRMTWSARQQSPHQGQVQCPRFRFHPARQPPGLSFRVVRGTPFRGHLR